VRSYNIAAIPGDGIGQEVVAAAVEVLLACAERDKGFALDFTNFDWGSERYKKFGALMPADGIETLKQFDAILSGPPALRTYRTKSCFAVFDWRYVSRWSNTPTSDRHVF
jgi:isocitrate/isopropylmalate dehydrogenase